MDQHRLTKTKIDAAKPRAKAYKLSDGGGLSLLIKPTNSRLWRLRYRQPGLTRVDDDGINLDGLRAAGKVEPIRRVGEQPTLSEPRRIEAQPQ